MSGLNLRLNVAEINFKKFSQISAYSLKAQWLSGHKVRFNEIGYKYDKFNQVIARYL
ncbi:hypothetical protein [Globicatella sanguinis]